MDHTDWTQQTSDLQIAYTRVTYGDQDVYLLKMWRKEASRAGLIARGSSEDDVAKVTPNDDEMSEASSKGITRDPQMMMSQEIL